MLPPVPPAWLNCCEKCTFPFLGFSYLIYEIGIIIVSGRIKFPKLSTLTFYTKLLWLCKFQFRWTKIQQLRMLDFFNSHNSTARVSQTAFHWRHMEWKKSDFQSTITFWVFGFNVGFSWYITYGLTKNMQFYKRTHELSKVDYHNHRNTDEESSCFFLPRSVS